MKKLDCLNNFIGVRDCGDDVEPLSCLYIDDLTGIDTVLLESIAGTQDCNGIALAKRLIEKAVRETCNEIKPRLKQAKVILNTTLSRHKIGNYDCLCNHVDDKKYLETTTEKGGIILKKDSHHFLDCIYIRGIWIDIKESGTFEIMFTSCNGSKNIKIEVCGEKKYIPINDYFLGEVLTIELSAGITPVDIDLDGFCNCHYSCSCVDAETTRKDGYTNGMCIELECRCCIDNILCSIMQDLKYAILYRAGVEILNELKVTCRVNESVLNSYSWIDRFIGGAEFKGEWVMKYEKELTDKLECISSELLGMDKRCFKCDSKWKGGIKKT